MRDVPTCLQCGQPLSGHFCSNCGRPRSVDGAERVEELRGTRSAVDVVPLRSGGEDGKLRRFVPIAVVAFTLAMLAWGAGLMIDEGARPLVASKHTLSGALTVGSTNATDACGYNGDARQRLERLHELFDGRTFPCPDGPGGGYNDLRDGTSVSVSDGAGTLLATGHLKDGLQKMTGVTFNFTVSELPDADFYKVSIGGRGELPYSKSDLESAGWSVSATIG